jgi:fructose-1,6-bisphosphatase/sedoheptulose 1,7-bisphosphatase-like protein
VALVGLLVFATTTGVVTDGAVSGAVSSGSHDGNVKVFMLRVGPGKNLVAANDVKIVGTKEPG